MLKFLWPVLKVYLRIPSLIWRVITYLFQTKHNYHPTWTHGTSHELDFMPHASDLFLSPNQQLGGKKYVLYFSLFTTWFLALQIAFREKLIPSPMRKRLPDINAFPANLNWRQDSEVFSGRLLNPDWSIQITRASRMKGGFLLILWMLCRVALWTQMVKQRINSEVYPCFLFAAIHHLNRPRLSLSDPVAQSAE